MDARRNPRTVIYLRYATLGSSQFAPPNRTQSGPLDPTTTSSSSPPLLFTIFLSDNSLSPVMIPPPRHASDSLTATTLPVNYRESDTTNEKSGVDDVVALSTSSPGWSQRGEENKDAAVAMDTAGTSLPGGFELIKPVVSVAASPLKTVSVVNMPIQLPAGT